MANRWNNSWFFIIKALWVLLLKSKICQAQKCQFWIRMEDWWTHLPLHPSLLVCPLHRQPLEVPEGGYNQKHQWWLMSAHLHTCMYGAVCWSSSPNARPFKCTFVSFNTWDLSGLINSRWDSRRVEQLLDDQNNFGPVKLLSLRIFKHIHVALKCPNTQKHRGFCSRHANEEQVVLSALRNKVVLKLNLQLSFWSFIIQILLSSTRLRSESHWLQQQCPPTALQLSECFYPHLVGTCCQLWKVKHQALEQPEKPFLSEPLPLERLSHSGNLATGGRGAFLWSGVLLGPHRKQI